MKIRTFGWQVSLLLISGWSMGCEHLGVRVEPPAMPEPVTAENDLIKAEYVGMGPSEDAKGVVAVRVTNKTDQDITLEGSQGATIPAKEGGKAWLVYRGDHDLGRFLKSGVKLELQGGEATVNVDVPEEGVSTLAAGQSRMVFVAFELPPEEKDLSIDLSPLVASNSVHDASGQLRALYLTVPVKDQPSLKDRAKKMIEQTKFGIELTSDDL